MRAALALQSIEVVDRDLLLRALEVYELDKLDFAEACLVAQAEVTGLGEIASLDRTIDRVQSISRRGREQWKPARRPQPAALLARPSA
jgi:predicted nucleic-acid-binding protein